MKLMIHEIQTLLLNIIFLCLQGEENLGKDYFEGDMILTPKQQAFLDNIKSNGGTQGGTKRALIKDTMYLWPKAKVYFDFHKGVGKFYNCSNQN